MTSASSSLTLFHTHDADPGPADRRPRTGFAAFAAALALASALASPTSARAAGPIEVTTEAATSSDHCTLSDALATARAQAQRGQCPWDGEQDIRLQAGKTYRLASVPAPVDFDLTIRGEFSVDDRARIEWAEGVSGRFFEIKDAGRLSTTHVVFDGGQADYGGALRIWPGTSVDLTNVTLENNSARFFGGAIYNQGDLEILKSTLANNSARSQAGAIYNRFSGHVRLSQSLLVGNSAFYGGAVYQIRGTFEIENTTFSANSGSQGGAIHNRDGAMSVDFSTFRNNSASMLGGTLFADLGTLSLHRSLLTTESSTRDLCWGSQYIQSDGANAFSDPSCLDPAATPPAVPDHQVGAPIPMSELVHHGGPTQVHVPRCDWTNEGDCRSPIIDQIQKRDCRSNGTAARDQRDQNDRWNMNTDIPEDEYTCDVGAYESICESHSYHSSGRQRSVLLHEWQLALGHRPVILDSGACFVHPACDPNDPDEPCDRISWSTDRGQVAITNVYFIDAQCRDAHGLDCFEDPDACLDTCPDSPPAGWVLDPDVRDGELAFLVTRPEPSLLSDGQTATGARAQKSTGGSSGESELVLRPYLLEMEDTFDPGAPRWRWDPQTPVLDEDVVEVNVDAGTP